MFGMLQGIPEVAGDFDLFFVNTLGLPFNSGLLAYVLLALLVLGFTYYQSIRPEPNPKVVAIGFLLSVILMGIPFIGSSWWMPFLIILALSYYLLLRSQLPPHTISLSTLSMFLFFMV